MPATQWLKLIHPAFEFEFNLYQSKALEAQSRVGESWVNTSAGKKFLALNYQIRQRIPSDPTNPEFRLGHTLGRQHKHWFRGKFLQQYRIFFRYSTRSRIIAYAWVNNSESLRKYGSHSDAYLVFKKMLESGKIPNNWDELVAESKKLS
jgi:toxin YhaV